jgi:hypothetical protein
MVHAEAGLSPARRNGALYRWDDDRADQSAE